MGDLKLEDLVAATGVTPRQIRYLIAEGFVPPPAGGRTYATYSYVHITEIRRYHRLRSLGFPPAAIRLLLHAKEGIPVPIVPGLTLVVAPELIGSGGDASTIGAKCTEKIEQLLAKQVCDERKQASR